MQTLFKYPLMLTSIALLLVGLVLFPGCGSDNDSADDGVPTSATSSRTASQLPAAPAVNSGATVTFTANGGNTTLNVYVARTDAEKSKGLMNIRQLDPDQGMIFIWDRPVDGGFWMKNTYIPLSIAFVSSEMAIVDIQDMEPQSLDQHSPPEPYQYAIEANQGYFREHGIAVGDTIELAGA